MNCEKCQVELNDENRCCEEGSTCCKQCSGGEDKCCEGGKCSC